MSNKYPCRWLSHNIVVHLGTKYEKKEITCQAVPHYNKLHILKDLTCESNSMVKETEEKNVTLKYI